MPASIDTATLQRLLADGGAQLVEVLPAKEFAEAHLPGAINIALTELDAGTAQRLDRARPVVAYCFDYQ